MKNESFCSCVCLRVSGYLFGPGGLVVAAGRLVFVVVQLLLVLRRPRRLLLLLLQRHQVRSLLLQLPLQPLGLPLLLYLLPLVLLRVRQSRGQTAGQTPDIRKECMSKRRRAEWSSRLKSTCLDYQQNHLNTAVYDSYVPLRKILHLQQFACRTQRPQISSGREII